MQHSSKYVFRILGGIAALYTGNTLCLAAYDSSVSRVGVYWVLNTAQSVCYTLIMLQMHSFDYITELSRDSKIGKAFWFSFIFAHSGVALQSRFTYDLHLDEGVCFLMKVYVCFIFTLNWLQFITYAVIVYKIVGSFLRDDVHQNPRLQALLQSRQHRNKVERLHNLCQLYPSQSGIRDLIDAYLPDQEHLIASRHYCEPIVMAYIFAVCTWVIPADDTVWIRETCEICSSAYQRKETILVNHEGQHLHEYCARRWFPSLKDDVTASKEQSTRVFDSELFGRWVLELPRLSKLRDSSHQQLPRPRRRR